MSQARPSPRNLLKQRDKSCGLDTWCVERTAQWRSCCTYLLPGSWWGFHCMCMHISSLCKRKTLHVVKQEAYRWHSKTAQSNRLSGIG